MLDENTTSTTTNTTTEPPAETTGDSNHTDTAAERPTSGRARRRAARRPAGPPEASNGPGREASGDGAGETPSGSASASTPTPQAAEPAPVALLFQPPDTSQAPPSTADRDASDRSEDHPQPDSDDSGGGDEGGGRSRSRRSRGGRRRRSGGSSDDSSGGAASSTSGGAASGTSSGAAGKAKGQDDGSTTEDRPDAAEAPGGQTGGDAGKDPASSDNGGTGTSRRRRRVRRGGGSSQPTAKDDADHSAKPELDDEAEDAREAITSVEGSTRIEAKKQRRREGREAGRRRPPILSESEFLARRESVERVMAIRQRGETTQIAVLEDNLLVEHYVALESQTSIIGNVYLGRVQNVLPSMEAAFIDIGKGRNAVLYAGEVNWDLREDQNQPRRIENALKPGQSIMVQVSKDPVGHKGARLTSQLSLPGRYLVYVPGGHTSGISRKLPDTERNRLKNLLKDILPDEAGVIIRTAAEGASEAELTRDVTRLTARWDDISKKAKSGQAPQLLYAEPDTTLKVVRDLFTEDFRKLVISGEDAWDMVDGYVQHVAPDLADRLERSGGDEDLFTSYRIDEQIAKALERKVWLPSGGSLVIDRTEAMTVIDVNTGKFTGSGGNLEETVTKNNLEAAEEIVRQLRLRDVGGIVVIDFIDMVLEKNRDLVLRRLVECLARDRTRHQVAEVTSLGLVQMTRKRIGTGLLEGFSHVCDVCNGRGVIIESDPVEPRKGDDSGDHGGSRGGRRSSGRRRSGRKGTGDSAQADAAESTG